MDLCPASSTSLTCILDALHRRRHRGLSHGCNALCQGVLALNSSVNRRDSTVIDEGLWLEFGVWRGQSTKALSRFHHVHAFDYFRGLPSKWRDAYVSCAAI